MSAVIGTAGWSIPRKDASAFDAQGSALQRYSEVFGGVEVNSSFHRRHRATTWARWAASVPDGFRFAVKIPKTITHQAKLVNADSMVAQLANEVAALGDKLAVLLVQLPPKLPFDVHAAARFFTLLQRSIGASVVCEPRNSTWFEKDADALLAEFRIARVASDPALGPAAAVPGGWRGIAYWRLHGSPMMYRSSYPDEAIGTYARQIRATVVDGIDTWCMFDNTAASAATANALSLMTRLGSCNAIIARPAAPGLRNP